MLLPTDAPLVVALLSVGRDEVENNMACIFGDGLQFDTGDNSTPAAIQHISIFYELPLPPGFPVSLYNTSRIETIGPSRLPT